MSAEQTTQQLVVIGASAGGIDALRILVSTLPADMVAPIIIAQHLDPSRVSHLADILKQHTALPIVTGLGEHPLRAGHIYVVPSASQVEVTDHHIAITADTTNRPLPSIDLLFSTAAGTFEENLIAIILTGGGSDGAAGARDVKGAGGTVIIQNPDTAQNPSMPLSLSPTTVDITAELEAIGPLVVDLLTGAHPGEQPREEQQMRLLLDELRVRSGIDFSSYKMPTIMRRLQRRMAATGTAKISEYVRFLQRHPSEYQRLTNSFLIKVTEFFRDPELFEHLRRVILPQLLDEARKQGELRIWSAGCATGEEAYSLAILVLDLLGDDAELLPIRIFATDLDADAVAFARRGIYPAQTLASVPQPLIERYFTRHDGEYEVRKSVRSLIIFGQHDLGQRSPFPRIDLTLCRNVLIYFTPDLQKRALQLFAFGLRDGGYLALGKAETVNPLPEFFVPEDTRLKVFRRIGERVLLPSTRIRDASPLAPLRAFTAHTPGQREAVMSRMRDARRQQPTSSEQAEAVMLRLPVGVVTVNRHYDIQMINVIARRLLGIHTVALGEDLIHRVQHIPLLELRNAIDASFQGKPTTIQVQISASDTTTLEPIDLQLQCYAETVEGSDGPAELVTILVTTVTHFVAETRARETELEKLRVDVREIEAQVRRVLETNDSLMRFNDELTGAFATMRSENEELLLANEEVQSATEEVETLNEELQATNEELETLNEELQATIEELNTTNDDLEARTVELQDNAIAREVQRRESEEERLRLDAILSRLSDAVMVIDTTGAIILRNAAFVSLFGDDGAGFQPEHASGSLMPDDALPQRRALAGETFSTEFTITQANGDRRWFEASGQPLMTDESGQLGLIVVRDLTDRSVRHLQDEFLIFASHELRTPLTALSGSIQLLRRSLTANGGGAGSNAGARELDPRVARHLDIASSQVRQLTVLTNDLVDIVRLQTGRLNMMSQPVNLTTLMALVAETATSFTDAQRIMLDAPAEPIVVLGDAGRIEQVLMNLVTNTISHAPSSTRIDIRLRQLDGMAEIQVGDDGQGIAAANLERIFSRFSQVASDRREARAGLGLGLYIAREIIRAHGGDIQAASVEGEGATFTVRLPLAG